MERVSTSIIIDNQSHWLSLQKGLQKFLLTQERVIPTLVSFSARIYLDHVVPRLRPRQIMFPSSSPSWKYSSLLSIKNSVLNRCEDRFVEFILASSGYVTDASPSNTIYFSKKNHNHQLCSIPGGCYTGRVAPYQSMMGLGPWTKSRQTRHSLGPVQVKILDYV